MELPINKILCGDALEVLKTFEDNCIDCCITSPPYFNLRSYLDNDDPNKKLELGLESTWQEYIKKLINIFNEVKRVLKKDGTCFVNLGDSFGGESSRAEKGRAGYGNDKVGSFKKVLVTDNERMYGKNNNSRLKNKSGSKCLMMIPERFALDMLDAGWILRNKLIWIKPNAMPESVQDRWKKAHEYIFFFTKNKKYYFNLNAIRTPHKDISIKRAEYEQGRNALGLNPSSVGEKYNRDKKHKDGTEKYYSMPARRVKLNPLGACPPDYLIINTNCSESDGSNEHYATYPQKLLWPLIKSGCPEGGIILDPFMGAGTTAVVAKKLSRNFIGIELNPKYIEIAEKRLYAIPKPLF